MEIKEKIKPYKKWRENHKHPCPDCGSMIHFVSKYCVKCAAKRKPMINFRHNMPHSEATKLKISKSLIGKNTGELNHYFGKKHSDETKNKIGLKSIGRNVEEKSGMWKGDAVGYFGLHYWVYKHLGRPTTCEHCGKTGLISHQIHWANKYHTYERNVEDWIRLCVKCHKNYDLGNY